jgi:hypothetical protein
MGIARDDRFVQDALGRSLAGAQVYWCLQPASTAVNPPTPVANVFTDLSATVPLTQPVLTDGFGHADAYMDNSVLYTVVIWHPLFGANPIVLIDQSIGGGGGGGGSTIVAFAGVPAGTIDGTNTVFTMSIPVAPAQLTVVLNIPLIPGLGYTSTWAAGVLTITYATAPQPAAGGVAADAIYAYGFYLV